MNDKKIEELLRQAPHPAPPNGVLEELQRTLPRTGSPEGAQRRQQSSSFLQRWFPAISFAAFFVVSVAVLGVQTNSLFQLRRENESLRAAAKALEQPSGEALAANVSARAQELERLRKENLELQKLRAEAEQLRSQLRELAALRAEKQRLQAESMASQAGAAAGAEADFFDRAKENATSVQCVSNLKQVGLAARLWANDNKREVLPNDMNAMSPYLPASKLFSCPASGLAYVILSPGASESEPQVVFAQCPTHKHALLADGSVQQLSDKRRVIQQNGRYVLSEPAE